MKGTKMIDWRTYLDVDPVIEDGHPVVRGTNLRAETILGELAGGSSTQQIVEKYPQVTKESIRAVFALAAESVHRKYPPKLPDEFFDGPEWIELPK